MAFHCTHCGSICPTYCYPAHRREFSCHNPCCTGHPSANAQMLSNSSYNQAGLTGHVSGPEPTRVSYGSIRGCDGFQASPPLRSSPPPLSSPHPPLPLHIQYFLNGVANPREHVRRHAPATREERHIKTPKTTEISKGRWRMSQAGPVWQQSAVQMLRDQPSISRIKKGLYVGNLACIDTEGFLESMKITAVVSVLTHRRNDQRAHPLNKAIPFEDQLFVKAYDTLDQDILQHFPGACEFIDKRLSPVTSKNTPDDETDDHYGDLQPRPFITTIPGLSRQDHRRRHQPQSKQQTASQPSSRKEQRVLIHCHAGISRSVTIAAAYLMWKRRQNLEDTLHAIRMARPIAQPNESFMAQLQLWWDMRFCLYRIPEFKVRWGEYEELKKRLRLVR